MQIIARKSKNNKKLEIYGTKTDKDLLKEENRHKILSSICQRIYQFQKHPRYVQGQQIRLDFPYIGPHKIEYNHLKVFKKCTLEIKCAIQTRSNKKKQKAQFYALSYFGDQEHAQEYFAAMTQRFSSQEDHASIINYYKTKQTIKEIKNKMKERDMPFEIRWCFYASLKTEPQQENKQRHIIDLDFKHNLVNLINLFTVALYEAYQNDRKFTFQIDEYMDLQHYSSILSVVAPNIKTLVVDGYCSNQTVRNLLNQQFNEEDLLNDLHQAHFSELQNFFKAMNDRIIICKEIHKMLSATCKVRIKKLSYGWVRANYPIGNPAQIITYFSRKRDFYFKHFLWCQKFQLFSPNFGSLEGKVFIFVRPSFGLLKQKHIDLLHEVEGARKYVYERHIVFCF